MKREAASRQLAFRRPPRVRPEKVRHLNRAEVVGHRRLAERPRISMRLLLCMMLTICGVMLFACSGHGARRSPAGASGAAVRDRTATPAASTAGRALVLGGGGLTGLAWEAGLLAGLGDQGIDLSTADLLAGTSAGAVVAGRLATGTDPKTLYAQVRLGGGPTLGQLSSEDAAYLLQTTLLYWTAGSENTPALRREVGSRALMTPHPIPEEVSRSGYARLLGSAWPQQHVKIAVVDAGDGTVTFFSSADGVSLGDAVAASTAIPGLAAPVTIGAHRYMDGGVAGTNIDAASGYRVVVAILPFPAGGKTEEETATVRRRGGDVFQLAPDARSLQAMGPNPLDGGRQAMAAEAGYRQAADAAAALRPFWKQRAESR
jgi:NTE family protein